MKVVKQLALFVENKPGTLASVCQALAKKRINILAISISDAVDHAVVRMVVDNATKALHLVGEHGGVERGGKAVREEHHGAAILMPGVRVTVDAMVQLGIGGQHRQQEHEGDGPRREIARD